MKLIESQFSLPEITRCTFRNVFNWNWRF